METFAETPMSMVVWYVGALDSLPEYVRALIAGALMVALLALARRRLPPNDVQFSISFAKVSLIALTVVPPAVWLLPAGRIVVFVEELEAAAPTLHLTWLLLLGLWSAGFMAGAWRLLRACRRERNALARLPAAADGHRLAARLRHWERRLGISRPRSLVFTGDLEPRHLPGAGRIVLPRAAEHWPAATQDLLIIHELCRVRKNHGFWQLFAALVACLYWPLAWVRRLSGALRDDFEIVTDRLAQACYEDELGYRRALNQTQQRLGARQRPGGRTPGSRSGSGPGRALAACRDHFAALWHPQASLGWNLEDLIHVHDRAQEVVWAEPGERLALLVGQAAFLAFLVGGVTLQQQPPEIERDYSLTLNTSWMDTAFPNRKRFDLPAHGGNDDAPETSSWTPPAER